MLKHKSLRLFVILMHAVVTMCILLPAECRALDKERDSAEMAKLEEIGERGVLKVGATGDYNPVSYLDPETESLYTYNNGYVASTVDISTLTRCVGSNYTCESFDFDTLRRIDVGANKGQQFAGTQIMTFKEWVLLCKKLGMELYIDHKMAYTNADILALFEIVKAAGMIEHASWIGLNVATATYLRTLDPNARIGILENPTQELIATYAPLNTNHNLFFNGNANELTLEAVQLGINAGFDVEAWMVDFLAKSESVVIDTINNVIEYGISGFTIDHYTLDKIYPRLYWHDE